MSRTSMMTGSGRTVTVSRSLVFVFIAALGSVALSAEPRAGVAREIP